jgi:hypothetical protein
LPFDSIFDFLSLFFSYFPSSIFSIYFWNRLFF